MTQPEGTSHLNDSHAKDRPKVMVVDDTDHVRNMLTSMLTLDGFTCSAMSGRACTIGGPPLPKSSWVDIVIGTLRAAAVPSASTCAAVAPGARRAIALSPDVRRLSAGSADTRCTTYGVQKRARRSGNGAKHGRVRE